MRIPGFIYGSNESQAFTADQERTINWYPEPPEAPGGRAALYPTPGVSVLATGASTPGRAHFYEGGREFAVIGTIFYEIARDGTLTNRGTVELDENPATICSNGDGGGQLFITSGTNAYYFTLSTNTLTQITDLNGKATMGDQLDGYFLCLDQSTSTVYSSALLDGSSWTTGTDYAQRSAASDAWVAMRVLGRHIWLLGEYTSEAWYNAARLTFPFAMHPAGVIPHGCIAPFSVAVVENSLMWLGSSRPGAGYVVRAQGFEPQVVSTAAMHNVISGYDNLSDAQAWVYSDRGHTFYVVNFLQQNATWAIDLATGIPHERGTWIHEENRFVAWSPRWYVRAFGSHRVLDGNSGDVYLFGPEYYSDVGSREIRRLRRAPMLDEQNRRVFFNAFELDLEPGVGVVTGQGSDPQIMMRFSDDGGKTWGAERMRSAGKIGEYKNRARWNRLGASRRRVFEVSVSDPVPWKLTDAYVDIRQFPEQG